MSAHIFSRKKKKYITGLFCISFFICLCAWEGMFASGIQATALSVKGQVQVLRADNWLPVKRGHKLSEGEQVRIQEDGFLRMVTPEGKMLKLSGKTETQLVFEKTGGKQETDNFSTFVAEFLSPNSRTRINAVRSHLTPRQQDWIAFAGFRRMPPSMIEAALELSAEYQKEQSLNRSIFILWKLSDLMPDDPGLRMIAKNAAQEHPIDGKWKICINRHNCPAKGVNISESYNGEGLAFQYEDNEEAYIYLFRTTKTENGQAKTEMLFPETDDPMGLLENTFFAARVVPEEKLIAKTEGVIMRKEKLPFSDPVSTLAKGESVRVLEKQGRRYRVRRSDGTEGWVLKHKLEGDTATEGKRMGDTLAEIRFSEKDNDVAIWGWAAHGPLPHHAIESVINGVETKFSKGKRLTEEVIKEYLPEICGAVTCITRKV